MHKLTPVHTVECEPILGTVQAKTNRFSPHTLHSPAYSHSPTATKSLKAEAESCRTVTFSKAHFFFFFKDSKISKIHYGWTSVIE